MAKRPKIVQSYRFASDIVVRQQLSPSIGNSVLMSHEQAVNRKGSKKSALRPLLVSLKLIYRVLALPIFAWYALYLATNQGYSYLLFMGWAIFTFVFVFAVWTSEHLGYLAKAKMTLLAPAAFSLAVVMVFVEAVSTVIKGAASLLSLAVSRVRLAISLEDWESPAKAG